MLIYEMELEFELMKKRQEFESREIGACKGCNKRVGIPCLISASCINRLMESDEDDLTD